MITRHAIRNAMIDAIEQICEDTGEYYNLNHLSADKLCELEDFLVKFLASVGFKFTL